MIQRADHTQRIKADESEGCAKSSQIIYNESLSFVAQITLYDPVDQVVSCVRGQLKCDGTRADFVFRRNGRVHLNWRGRQFSRLLAAEVCALAVVMLDTPCSEVVRRVLATHSIRQFPLRCPSRASPCAITIQL